MYIAVRRYSAGSQIFDDLKQRIENEFFPQLKRVQGFISYYVFSTGPDTFDTISVFESEDGERKSTELAAEFVKRNYPNHQVERMTLDEGPCVIEHDARVPA